MNVDNLGTALQGIFTPQLLGIASATAILVIGWLLAVIVRAGVRRGLSMTRIDAMLEARTGRRWRLADAAAIGCFWFVILLTLVAILNTLHLQAISAPLETIVGQVAGYLPRLFAGAVLLALAWGAASIARLIVGKTLASTSLDERLSEQAGMQPMSRNVANALFWLILLMFIPAIVTALGIEGLLAPMQNMLNQFLLGLPGIFGAIIIVLAGWLIAAVLRGLTANVLRTLGVDRYAEQAGLASVNLSYVAGTVVFVLVMIPVLIAAVEKLGLTAVVQPASAMLQQLLSALPNIFAAVLILAIVYFAARLLAALVVKASQAMGIDQLPKRFGMATDLPDAVQPSRIAGSLVMLFAMTTAAATAAARLSFAQLAELLRKFVEFAGNVLLGAIILLAGFWLANLAYAALRQGTSAFSATLAQIVRVAIVGLVLAMGLRAMGIANDIVNLAFGLTLGSVAVAVALAFGLGGREAAGRQLARWFDRSNHRY